MSTTLTHGPLLLADNDGKYGVALKKTELASPSHTMFFTFFRAAWNAGRTRKVSVCPSVKRVHCDKTEKRSVQIFIPYERSFTLVL